MRILRLRFFKNNKKNVILIAFFLVALICIFKKSSNINRPQKGLKNVFIKKYINSLADDNCFSAFDNLNKINLNLFKKNKISDCSKADLIILNYKHDHVVLYYNYDYLKKNNIKIDHCEYATVSWYKNDFGYKLSKMISFGNGKVIEGDGDLFIYVICKYNNSSVQYKTAYARILKSNRQTVSNHKQPLNVFMLGFDSVSRKLWLSSLANSTYYLVNSLKSTILNGFNILGDGTPAAVCT
jgi:hypothetical protein